MIYAQDRGRKPAEPESGAILDPPINVPRVVIQGANDPRVRQAESDQIMAALHDLGRPVEHLGGRFQEDIRPEVHQRLQALTVDVSTVGGSAETARRERGPGTRP